MSELVELGHIIRSDIARKGGEHLSDRDAEGLGLDPVDDDRELRRARPVGGGDPLQSGLRVGVADHGVGQALQQRVVEIAVLDFGLHGEAADVADALDRRRGERERDGFRDALQPAVQAQGDRAGVLSGLFKAHVPVLQEDKSDARVGEARQVVEDRKAADGDHMFDARHSPGNL